MGKRLNWQLMSVEELAVLILSMGKDNTNYRQQKHHYKKTNNTVMIDRLKRAEILSFGG